MRLYMRDNNHYGIHLDKKWCTTPCNFPYIHQSSYQNNHDCNFHCNRNSLH